LFPLSSFGYSSSPDSSHPKHIGVTTVISSFVCGGLKSGKVDYPVAAAAGIASALLVGHIKESRDYQYDKSDMIANGLGSGLGASLCFLF